jgi:hypothetical protein
VQGAPANEFSLTGVKDIMFVPADVNVTKDSKEVAQTQAASLIWLTWSALTEHVQMKPDLAKLFWSLQYSGPAKNMLSPVKPCFGLTSTIEIPKDKAIVLTQKA